MFRLDLEKMHCEDLHSAEIHWSTDLKKKKHAHVDTLAFNSKCCIMCRWNVHLVTLHYITATQVEHIPHGIWKWTYFAADRARSHSYPCAFQAPSRSPSSGKLHLYVHASGGWYNSLDAPQCWWRIMQFPYEWLWLHFTDLCTWKIGIL